MIEPLVIKSNRIDVPRITLDKEQSIFLFEGESFPEDPVTFYAPVIEWLENYKKNPNPETIFNMKIEYMNTSSTKLITDLLFNLQSLNEDGKTIRVNWHFKKEDEDNKRLGEDISFVTGLPFEFIET